jgi:hypothetical protein
MRDRAVLIALAVLVVLGACFGALWGLHDYAVPIFVNGNAMARRADATAGDLLAARFPSARVGAVRCPWLLDLTGGRSARCAIPIGSDELAIDVALREDRRGVEFHHVDALFVTPDGERRIASDLDDRYGEHFAVHCPGAAVRVLHGRSTVSCDVEAPGVGRQQVAVQPYGDGDDLLAPELPGVATREARVLGPDVAATRTGSVTIEGPALERYLRGTASAEAHGDVGRRGLAGAAHCPPHVVLHEGTHVRCTVAVADVTLQFDVHFEKGLGLRTDADHTVAVVATLHDVATRYVERRERARGVRRPVDVNCGTVPVIVIEPGSTLRCVANTASGDYDMTFRFLDPGGDFSIERTAP